MLPIHKAKLSVFNYDEIPAGYYHRVMIEGNAIQRFWHREKFKEVARRIAPEASVLDFGCGPGSFLSVLAEVHPQAKVVGVDVASRQIEYARTTIAPKIPYGRGTFQVLDSESEKLPFPDASFDVVTCIEVIEHIHPYYALRMLLEARRVLKPEGKLVVTTPNYRSFWPLIELALEWLSPVKYHDQHINRYTPNALVKFLESAGFDLNRVDTIFCIAPFLASISPSIASRLHEFERERKSLVGSLLVAEAKIGRF